MALGFDFDVLYLFIAANRKKHPWNYQVKVETGEMGRRLERTPSISMIDGGHSAGQSPQFHQPGSLVL